MSTSKGRIAETVVREWLFSLGHKVIQQNWRTRYCEVDLISYKNQTLYFFEVKYRLNKDHGSGLDYVNVKKQERLRFAARLFITKYRLTCQSRIFAIEVHGSDFVIDRVVEVLSD